MSKKPRRGSQTRKAGSQRKLIQEEDGDGESHVTRRRLSQQRLVLSADQQQQQQQQQQQADEDEEKMSSSTGTPDLTSHNKEPPAVVLSAELVFVEPEVSATMPPVEVISPRPKKKQLVKRRSSKSRAQEEEEPITVSSFQSYYSESLTLSNNSKRTSSTTTTTTTTTTYLKRPKYPRSFLGMMVRIVKILHALLNIIVIRGSVLTRRKLHTKLEDYLLQQEQQQQQQQDQVQDLTALYGEHISHHLFVFYLSWGRLLVCLIVLMWGTCTNRLPKPIAIYIGMAMHWIDSIRALDSTHWLPSSSDTEDHTDEHGGYRSSTAEEEVQTAMAWLHLFWFVVDGVYCRQILKKRRYEEQRIQRELYDYLSGIQEEEEGEKEKEKENEFSGHHAKQSKRD